MSSITGFIKDLISIIKELKPILRFFNNEMDLSQSQIKVLKLFIYYFLVVVFLMVTLVSITLMLIKLPLVGSSFDTAIIYSISSTAKSFMDSLVLIGYILILVVLSMVFALGVWGTAKKLYK